MIARKARAGDGGIVRWLDARADTADVARKMREAVLSSLLRDSPAVPGSCRVAIRRLDESVLVLIFSRDVGHHTSGWWKNPDYERCEHLSLSLQSASGWEPLPQRLVDEWTRAFYGDAVRYVWEEGPYSPEGLANNVHHYRVFCDPAWKPIVPRGEVYSRELTEAGWKSWSDRVHDEEAAL